MVAKNSQTNAIYTDLQRAVSEGTFVPFVGPRASTMRSACQQEWDVILKRLEVLVYDINN
ncbi:MAG: hypothetical protein FD146_2410 [Anaerolineaceae bacterium]|nr:MAG: hypothetical protein FD146_2410 [Anaerolineaceae bacterium]